MTQYKVSQYGKDRKWYVLAINGCDAVMVSEAHDTKEEAEQAMAEIIIDGDLA